MWYVVQVKTSYEDNTIAMIKRTIESGTKTLKECFCPTFEMMGKFKGEWKRRRHPLFPGYVIADSEDAVTLNSELRKVPAFTSLLKSNGSFTALCDPDVSWIESFTSEDNRTIGLSQCIVEGDEVVIAKGPLLGHTAWIEKINLHKRVAYLKIFMFGREIKTKAGIEILHKR